MSNITNNLKKSIYDCLSSQSNAPFTELTGIFTYVDKNQAFPYVFISVENMKDNSTFSKSIYTYSVSIEIFDKSLSTNFVMSVSEEIKNLFKMLSNFTSTDFSIVDVLFKENKMTMENNNTIQKSRILFDFIISVN